MKVLKNKRDIVNDMPKDPVSELQKKNAKLQLENWQLKTNLEKCKIDLKKCRLNTQELRIDFKKYKMKTDEEIRTLKAKNIEIEKDRPTLAEMMSRAGKQFKKIKHDEPPEDE